jgi:uncharacterized protein
MATTPALVGDTAAGVSDTAPAMEARIDRAEGSVDPAGDGMSQPRSLPAGEFSVWLRGMQAALRGEADSDVPCGACTACCTSSQFVHIEPDESDTLEQIPPALLFPAPGQPPGHVLLGYDQDGNCPMFVDGGCSIYAHRPRTCRVYDCRLFAAIGRINEHTPLIAERIRAWEFSYADEASRAAHDAVRAAGTLPDDILALTSSRRLRPSDG